MLKEGLNALVELVGKSHTPVVSQVPGVRHQTLLAVKGEAMHVDHSIPARCHKACSLDAIVEYADGSISVIWHRDNSIVCVLDDGCASYRDDTITYDIPVSAKWSAIGAMVTPRNQKDFIAFIVANLRDELQLASPGLLGKLRTLKMTLTDDETGDIQQGRESMGRSVARAVIGADDLPETIVLTLRRWASFDYEAKVECLLELNVAERTLRLVPLADAVEQAEQAAQKWLADHICRQVDCPVYYGAP